MADEIKKPRLFWLLMSLGLVIAVTGMVSFFLNLSVTIMATIMGLGSLATVIGFGVMRYMLNDDEPRHGWADPVLDPDEVREAFDVPVDNPKHHLKNDTRKTGEVPYSAGDDEEKLVEELVQMGRLLLKSERYDEARDYFKRATDKDPGNSKCYNYLGISCGRLNMFDEAIDAYNKAIALDYDYASAHFNLASVYEQMNDKKGALMQWQRYLDVGKVVGERDDMLQRAQDRLDRLKDGTAKMPKKTGKFKINQEES